MLLAVFNDGAMIALSKDRVMPSELPNSWKLNNIFITGIVYGIYLSLSSWVLLCVPHLPEPGTHVVAAVADSCLSWLLLVPAALCRLRPATQLASLSKNV